MNNPRNDNAIKFKLTLKRAPAPEQAQVIALEKWRALFFRLGLVGEYPNEQIGYGNLSSRLLNKSFIITGSQTGHLAHLQAHHYTRVIDCDLKKGFVVAEGLIPPSSESLTHFGIYQSSPAIQCIFHVHHPKLWEQMQREGATVMSDEFNFGSYEMAEAFSEILKNKTNNIILLNDPKDGILSCGNSAEEAGKNILEIYRKLAVRQ